MVIFHPENLSKHQLESNKCTLNQTVIFVPRMCPIFQISNVTGENMDLLKMFLNLLSPRTSFKDDEPPEFQIDDTYSVPVCYILTLSFSLPLPPLFLTSCMFLRVSALLYQGLLYED